MGVFRFLLALSVILEHTGPLFGFDFAGGPVAVEAFFIISGFYIALILNEKYVDVDNSYWLFISNRFLRLYPMYWVALILTILCALLIPHFNEHAVGGGLGMYQQYGKDLNITTYLYFIITNVFIFFQDTALFLGLDLKTGGFFYTPKFQATNPLVWRFELIQQAWSIGLELTFYLIAPFIVRRKWWIVLAVLLLSMICKFVGSQTGYRYDPWSYRFFPFELMYFLLGAMAYIFYTKYMHKVVIPKFISVLMLVILLAFTIFFTKLPFRYAYPLYILCTFSFIPFLFKYTKSFKIDRWVGELSYPIYIIHILVFNISKDLGIIQLNVATILGSIALSIVLNKLIGDSIEKLRQSRVVKSHSHQKTTLADDYTPLKALKSSQQ